jgi:hypothetical protein
MRVFVDAAFGVHKDFRSHTGSYDVIGWSLLSLVKIAVLQPVMKARPVTATLTSSVLENIRPSHDCFTPSA